jgi:transcriptional regulator with XRE-family HTH domain
MSTIVDEVTHSLAQRIRAERDARRWSLAELAAEAGVSRAMISKIERGEASPTAAILVRLAGAFRLTLAGLIARAEAGDDRLVRAGDQARWRDPATGYRRRQVFQRFDHPVELARIELPPGKRVDLPASSYTRIRQVVWVEKGSLLIEEAGVRSTLSTGDSLAFGPPADSSFINESDAPCIYLIALSRSAR